MDQEPDVIRQQIDETRSSLTEKLEALEGEVRGTVQGAKETVEETVESVKSTVQETVQSVKRTFDLNYQVNQHPWMMLGGSVLAGFVVGNYLLSRPGRQPGGGYGRSMAAGSRTNGQSRATGVVVPSTPAAELSEPGLLSRVVHQFDDEIEKVKEVAIGAAMGLARDYVKQNLPQFAPQIDDIMNGAQARSEAGRSSDRFRSLKKRITQRRKGRQKREMG